MHSLPIPLRRLPLLRASALRRSAWRNAARRTSAGLLCLGLLAAGPAAAWGPGGHQAVGAVADQLIAGTPTAKKVKLLLGSNLQTASVWADCARSVQSNKGVWTYAMNPAHPYPECAVFEKSDAGKNAMIDYVKRNASSCGGPHPPSSLCRHKSYHFVDLPIQHPQYKPDAVGAAPNDLVQAISAALVVLQGGKSPAPFNIKNPAEAVRLLSHFVGDLHQPLHVGSIYLSDGGQPLDPANPQDAKLHDNAGGNGIVFEGRNLHSAWDGIPAALYKAALAGDDLAAARQVPATAGALATWPVAWADETASVASQAFKDLHLGAKLTVGSSDSWPGNAAEPAYRQAQQALQKDQIVKAGARLAKILRTVLP